MDPWHCRGGEADSTRGTSRGESYENVHAAAVKRVGRPVTAVSTGVLLLDRELHNEVHGAFAEDQQAIARESTGRQAGWNELSSDQIRLSNWSSVVWEGCESPHAE